MKSSDEKSSIHIKNNFLQKKTSVYHIKIRLFTVSYMKCQKWSRMGGTAARRGCGLQLPGLGIKVEHQPGAGGRRAGSHGKGEKKGVTVFSKHQ